MEVVVEIVTVSPGYRIVIPRSVRETLGIRPGQRMQVIPYENRIEIIPLRPAREMRGFLRGMSMDLEREPDRL
jgi:AbrB family looped-hinge helix DNA binding protein